MPALHKEPARTRGRGITAFAVGQDARLPSRAEASSDRPAAPQTAELVFDGGAGRGIVGRRHGPSGGGDGLDYERAIGTSIPVGIMERAAGGRYAKTRQQFG